ncbi:MAG: type II toxin-antitoxin system HicB family antitoxin [Acidobacteriota bacterium]
MRYAVIIEKDESTYHAYVPDLPGCATTGVTLEEAETLIRQAIQNYINLRREEGLPIPEPSSIVEYIEA